VAPQQLQTEEHFEASFLMYVGEQREINIVVGNLDTAGLAALASVTCSVDNPSGVLVIPQPTATTYRTGAAELKGEVAGTFTTFSFFFKGLQEGDYSISCVVQDLGGQ